MKWLADVFVTSVLWLISEKNRRYIKLAFKLGEHILQCAKNPDDDRDIKKTTLDLFLKETSTWTMTEKKEAADMISRKAGKVSGLTIGYDFDKGASIDFNSFGKVRYNPNNGAVSYSVGVDL